MQGKMPTRFHTVQIGSLSRELPVVPVSESVSVALFNMLGDTAITEEAGKELAKRLPEDIKLLITPEVKALSLAHVISRETGVPYVVVRKGAKPYMVSPVVREVNSITTGKPQLLALDGNDVAKIKGQKVAIVDDVVSSGGTLHSLRHIISEVEGELAAVLAVFTEGEARNDVIALGHLPLFSAQE